MFLLAVFSNYQIIFQIKYMLWHRKSEEITQSVMRLISINISMDRLGSFAIGIIPRDSMEGSGMLSRDIFVDINRRAVLIG